MVRKLIEQEYATIGVSSPYSIDDLAEISLALFGGLAVGPIVGEAVRNSVGFTPAWLLAAQAVAMGAGFLAVGPLLDTLGVTGRWRVIRVP